MREWVDLGPEKIRPYRFLCDSNNFSNTGVQTNPPQRNWRIIKKKLKALIIKLSAL